MLKYLLYAISIYSIISSEVQAGLIDSLAEVKTKNETVAQALPQKKNFTSKYACLLNKNKGHLGTVVDAHKPLIYHLKDADATQKNIDVNKLSEKQLEDIGDAAIAEKLTDVSETTSVRSTSAGGLKNTTEIEDCVDQ